MLTFIAANIGTIVVGLIVLAIVAAIVYSMINNKKKGKPSCGCGCEGCAHKCH